MTHYRSVAIDPNDHLAQFHLGLQMALLRQVSSYAGEGAVVPLSVCAQAFMI
jgi:hypothetical protein